MRRMRENHASPLAAVEATQNHIHSARSLEAVARPLALSPRTPTVLDALYANQDEEYLDATALEKALGQAESP